MSRFVNNGSGSLSYIIHELHHTTNPVRVEVLVNYYLFINHESLPVYYNDYKGYCVKYSKENLFSKYFCIEKDFRWVGNCKCENLDEFIKSLDTYFTFFN